MRIREITESQQLNELAFIPLIVGAIRLGMAAYGVYNAYQGYQTFRAWQRGEIDDHEFATQIGQDALNTLTAAAGSLAALKAIRMSQAAWARAWATAGSEAATATLSTIAAKDFYTLQGSEALYNAYTKLKNNEITLEQLRNQIGLAAFDIIQNVIQWYGIGKIGTMSLQAFRRGLAAIRRRAAPVTSIARNAAQGTAALGTVAAADAAADEITNNQ